MKRTKTQNALLLLAIIAITILTGILAGSIGGCSNFAHPCDCAPDAKFEQDGHQWTGYRIVDRGRRFSTTWQVVHDDSACTNEIHHK